MDAQDIRNLQEAYLEVYDELDEARRESGEEDWRKSEIRNFRRHKLTGTTTPYTDRIVAHHKNRGVKKVKGAKVQEDIYDIILSHLLDEGYAETIESAEIIMVNMSEDWRESIVEEILNEAKADEDLTPLQKIRKRNKAYALPGEPAGQQTSNRRAERSSTRGVKRERGAKSAFGTMRNVGGPYN